MRIPNKLYSFANSEVIICKHENNRLKMLLANYRVILVICSFCFLNDLIILSINAQPTFAKQNRTISKLQMPRLDNRNSAPTFPVFGRKPSCNKRIRLINGVTRFRDKGSFVRFTCSHGYTLIGATIAVCLRENWSEPPPICVKAGCRSIMTPPNGVARLMYAGGVATFYCLDDHTLEGNTVLFCDGSRWNATEPTCLPNQPPTTTMKIWEWAQRTTQDSELFPPENPQSWDYNDQLESSTNTPTSIPTFPTTHQYFHTEPPSTTNESPSSTLLDTLHETQENFMPISSRNKTSTSITIPFIKATTMISETTTQTTIATKRPTFTTLALEILSSTIQATTSTTNLPHLPIPTTTKQQTEPTTQSVTTLTTTVKNDSPTTTTEEWKEPFPDNTFDKFDEEFGITYEPQVPTHENEIVHFQPFEPISPYKLDDNSQHEYYKNIAHVSIIGGIVLGTLLVLSVIGGIASYFYMRNFGIARRNENELDGRTLSDANDDFMWMIESNEPRQSRL